MAVTGVGHVREETADGSPTVDGVTPDREVGERHREVHPCVFVLDMYGTPLQPTNPARARKFLAKGRAVVARHTPFTIRLKDRSVATSDVDGVELGVDPGSRHTGIAVFTVGDGERRGRYSLQLDHRGTTITQKLKQRSAYRRSRRVRKLRYRKRRFLNRSRPTEWLSPSMKHRVDTTLAWVERLRRWAPARAVHVERIAFDTHALSEGRPLNGVEYQQGTLHGYEVREYLLAKWGRSCAYCGVSDTPLNIDHVHPRSKGGSDRISNLALACVPCNQAKDARPVREFLRGRPETLARVLEQVRTPLRDAAAVNTTRWALWRSLSRRLDTRAASGGRTKWNRTRVRLPKSHTLDALAVGELDTVTQVVISVLVVGCTGRGTHARTRTDRHGFPRLRLPRQKYFFGFTTGDHVRAVVPTGKRSGTYVGRVAVRARGYFNISTPQGTVQGIHHRHIRLLQRADGYACTTQKEAGTSSLA